ncbi:hypothetical protein [Tolypothrix sp. VBCCA 56010]|uniref:hypothetical protein n=1 Tax=Tolypothrix sp. VBCCA 56010 TaxID=3137731 RepID=UPI003D7D979D
MNCYKFLVGAIVVIVSGIFLVINSDKSRSELRPDGNITIKVSGGLLLMFGILVLIGSFIGLSSGCQPQSIL